MRSTGPATRLLVPAALVAALISLATAQNPVAGAQTTFLTWAIGGTLAAVALLSRRGGVEAAAAAVPLFAVAAITGQGPHRSAAIFLLLAAAVAWTAGRTFLATARPTGADRVSAVELAALATALQFLLRTDLFLPPLADARSLISLGLLPLAAAGAVLVLARTRGWFVALTAGAVAATLGPGWNVTSVLSLTCLAVGCLLADRSGLIPERAQTPVRLLALAVLATPVAWDPMLGALIALAGAAPALRGRLGWVIPLGGGMVLAYALDAPPNRALIVDLWLLGLLTIPTLLLAPRERRALLVRGLLLALVAAVVAPRPDALIAGLALASTALSDRDRDRVLQLSCSGVLLFAVALLAAPPWRRPFPLDALLELLHLEARIACLPILLAAALLARAPRSMFRYAGAAVATVVLAAGLYAIPQTVDVPISWQRVALTAEQPTWRVSLDAPVVSEIVVESSVETPAEIPEGVWVGILRIKTVDGRTIRRRLKFGEHVGRTSDEQVDSASVRLAPLSHDGARPARRFLASFELEDGVPVELTALRLNPELPAATRWTIHRLELRR